MSPDEYEDEAWTEDAALGGRLRLTQPRRGHRFGHDAILLAAATAGRAGWHAVDLGAGVGAAGLALALRTPGLRLSLVEIDPRLAGAARRNAERNGLAERAIAHALDVAAPAAVFAAKGLTPGVADCVLMNPPFHDTATRQPSPDPQRRRAHAAADSQLTIWVQTACRLLRPGGSLTAIQPPDRLPRALTDLGCYFGAIAILPVYAKPDAPAIRVLLRAVKDSRGPLALLPGLLLNNADGRPTTAAESVLRAGAPLPLADL